MEFASTGYACKECGAAVTMTDKGPLRPCTHTGTVIASMQAVATGEGGAATASVTVRARALIARVLRQIGAT